MPAGSAACKQPLPSRGTCVCSELAPSSSPPRKRLWSSSQPGVVMWLAQLQWTSGMQQLNIAVMPESDSIANSCAYVWLALDVLSNQPLHYVMARQASAYLILHQHHGDFKLLPSATNTCNLLSLCLPARRIWPVLMCFQWLLACCAGSRGRPCASSATGGGTRPARSICCTAAEWSGCSAPGVASWLAVSCARGGPHKEKLASCFRSALLKPFLPLVCHLTAVNASDVISCTSISLVSLVCHLVCLTLL